MASCGLWSVLTSVLQQPIFAMSPQLPCIERQHALSSWFIVFPVIQASKGAAAESRTKIATKLARRRTIVKYIPLSTEGARETGARRC